MGRVNLDTDRRTLMRSTTPTDADRGEAQAPQAATRKIGAAALLLSLSSLVAADTTGQYIPGHEFKDCEDCPQMVVVPAGSFAMGSPDTANVEKRLDHEGPQHEVTIPEAFAIGKFEVTRGQYAYFVRESGHVSANYCDVWTGVRGGEPVRGKSWEDPNFAQTDEHPVVCISWNDARAYVGWLAEETDKPYRLLSEAEWEYATRAGTTTQYSFGDSPKEICSYGNVPDRTAEKTAGGWYWKFVECDDGYGAETAPVGSFLPNAFGLHDVHGNVWEWVQDCYHDSFEGAPVDGSAWMKDECSGHVVRGGSLSAPVYAHRSAFRFQGNRETRSDKELDTTAEFSNFNLGLRVGRSLD
jgi:formylglycine-generating enzyme required for sulfatase activity